MEPEPESDQLLLGKGVDSVAQAIISVLSIDPETEKQSSLRIFLIKLYKNNTSPKSKKMNSIRLSRFNTFLYRVNLNYPIDSQTNQIICLSILAALCNDKNFLQEEDEETVMSIARWTCLLLQNSIEHGFYEPVETILNFLIEDTRPNLLPISAFQDLVRQSPYFISMQLTENDQRQAFRDPMSYNITTTFNLKEFILKELKIKQIYSMLFEINSKQKQVLRLFKNHINKIVVLKDIKIQIFHQIFLNRSLISPESIQNVLEILEEGYFNAEYTERLINLIIIQQSNIQDFFKVSLKGTQTDQLFFERLSHKLKTLDIDTIINYFLNCKNPKNLILLYVILNSVQTVPKKYISLIFQSPEILYQQAIIIGLAIAHNTHLKIQSELIDQYLKQQSLMTPQRKRLCLYAINYSITNSNIGSLFSNIARMINLQKMGEKVSFDFLPQQQCKAQKLSSEDKRKLINVLESYSADTEQTFKIKIELMGLCGCDLPLTSKIRNLTVLFQKPIDQILKAAIDHKISKDPQIFAVYLMGLNNKLQLYCPQQPNEEAINILISSFLHLYNSFGKSLAAINDSHQVEQIKFLTTLMQYNFHTGKSLGNQQGLLAELLSGSNNYHRLKLFNFSQYFINQQKNGGNNIKIAQLWANKKVMFQLRQALKKLIDFEHVDNSSTKKEIKGLFDSNWGYAIAAKLIQRYIYSGQQDSDILRNILKTFKSQYTFFEMVEKQLASQFQEYADVLELIPQLLQIIYPEALNFMAKLIQSSPITKKQKEKDKDKQKEKEKEKEKPKEKKKGRKKKNDKSQMIPQKTQKMETNSILDNDSLFQIINQRNQLRYLFGDPLQLQNFSQLFKIISRITDRYNMINSYLKDWLPKIRIFHCQSPDKLAEWKNRLLSYCEMWRIILVEKHYQIQSEQLQRHFLLLSELLNTLYESKTDSLQLQSNVLMTLLLIYQANVIKNQTGQYFEEIPHEALRNVLLGFRIPSSPQQHYYHCFTCEMSVCQICAPFLHKNHDLNFTGKEGTCVHDSTKNRKSDSREDRDNRDSRFQTYQGNLQAGLNFAQYNLMSRNIRKQKDFFTQVVEFGEQDMDFGERMSKNILTSGFKQIMELRKQQMEKERQLLHLKERQKNQYEKFQAEDQKQINLSGFSCQILSQSSKSIKNLDYYIQNRYIFEPQFNPSSQNEEPPTVSFDASPLRKILLRQLQFQGSQDSGKSETNKITVNSLNQRYNFFNKSNYFRSNRADYGLMRGFGGNNISISKRNVLTSNKKYLAFPSANNGILLLSMSNIIAKIIKRQVNKNYGQFELEKNYLANAINNNSINFEPYQLLFSKSNLNLLAVVGLTQLGFIVLNNDGKLQKFIQADFKSVEPIIKFQWLSRQRNIFAVCCGSNIRIGNINEELRVRTTNKFKVQIDRVIRDFQINIEGGGQLFAYIIDNQGCIYRSQFDYRDSKTVNITAKAMSHLSNLDQLHSLIFVDKKLFLSAGNGKCHLLKVDGRTNQPIVLQTFNLQNALRLSNDNKNIRPPFYLSQLKIIHQNQNTFSIACILKRLNGDSKKKGGFLSVVRVSGKNNLQLLLLSQEDSVESFEVVENEQNNYLFTVVEQNGSVWVCPYTIPSQLLRIKDETKFPMSDGMIAKCNKLIKNQSLLDQIKFYEPKRFTNFKETKDLSNCHNSIIIPGIKISIISTQPNKYFYTGFSLEVEPPVGCKGIITFNFLGELYRFEYDKPRQIQFPLNIKESIDLFVLQAEINIEFISNGGQIKNVKMYGVDFNSESIFKRAYSRLFKMVIIHLSYDFTNLQHYLENAERTAIDKLKFTDMEMLKKQDKYKTKQINILLKIQLLRLSIQNDMKGNRQLEDILHSVKCYILPLCEQRQYLEKSCWKLIRRVSQLMIKVSNGTVGHPFQYRTILDFYYFERNYYNWTTNKSLGNFQILINFLYGLIFKRVSNLYLIFKINPNLIYELTFFYKASLHSLKNNKIGDGQQPHLMKLITICSNYVALICEYYQTLKNNGNQMIDQSQQNQSKSPQKIILDFLQEVFCAIKKELYRQIFISPEVYLQKLYLSKREQHKITTAVDIFTIKLNQNNQNDHASRKASLSQQQIPVQESEQDIQLYEQSQKQVMEDQQAQQMVQISEQKSHIKLQHQKMVPEAEEKQPNDKFKHINHILNSHLLGKNSTVSFIYHQFNFEMVTALFKLNNYLNPQNVIFYLGFFFNLLRIVEINLDSARDQDYISVFFKNVLSKLYSSSHSILYMVLNYFIEPKYGTKINNNIRQIQSSGTKLSQAFMQFLKKQDVDVASLFLNFKITKTYKIVSMSEAMKFTPFELQNHLYQLKFLGNLYINLKSSGHPSFTKPNDSLKQFILSVVVRYRLRVYYNIMLIEGWFEQLQGAKVDVGFETLQKQTDEGVNMLYECSKSNPKMFINKLSQDIGKIQKLQELLNKKLNKQNKILEMLTTYYQG